MRVPVAPFQHMISPTKNVKRNEITISCGCVLDPSSEWRERGREREREGGRDHDMGCVHETFHCRLWQVFQFVNGH